MKKPPRTDPFTEPAARGSPPWWLRDASRGELDLHLKLIKMQKETLDAQPPRPAIPGHKKGTRRRSPRAERGTPRATIAKAPPPVDLRQPPKLDPRQGGEVDPCD